jgi:phenylpropionate dioxygenase-like ring-hydroxylating dioxygenase large terminal subunit
MPITVGTPSEPPALDLPEELTDDAIWGRLLCFAHWNTNYRYAIDNVMAPMHGSYLHAVSHSRAYGDKTAEMAVGQTPHGLIFEKTNQKDVRFRHHHRLRDAGGEDNCVFFFRRVRKVQGWKRDVWKFLPLISVAVSKPARYARRRPGRCSGR